VSDAAPIGVFDSGIGGLSVLRAIRAELPGEALLYVADSAHAPYGERDAEAVGERVDRIAAFLLERGAKAIVIACNTATAMAAARLRAWCPVPVVGIEPAVKPAAALTRSGVIGVLATPATAASEALRRLGERHARGIRLVVQPCPGLADRIEQGAGNDAELRAMLERFLAPLQRAGADVIALGCTHYALVAQQVRALVGDTVQLIDPAPAVARELARRLGSRAGPCGPGAASFFSSAAAARMNAGAPLHWGGAMQWHPLGT
jgi:glutamate racemase